MSKNTTPRIGPSGPLVQQLPLLAQILLTDFHDGNFTMTKDEEMVAL